MRRATPAPQRAKSQAQAQAVPLPVTGKRISKPKVPKEPVRRPRAGPPLVRLRATLGSWQPAMAAVEQPEEALQAGHRDRPPHASEGTKSDKNIVVIH